MGHLTGYSRARYTEDRDLDAAEMVDEAIERSEWPSKHGGWKG
jgi:hypothetical protein